MEAEDERLPQHPVPMRQHLFPPHTGTDTDTFYGAGR